MTKVAVPNGSCGAILGAALMRAPRKVKQGGAARRPKKRDDAYRLLFELNPQPLYLFDLASLRFLAVNEAALKQYGYGRREFLSLTSAELRPKEERERFLARMREVASEPLRGPTNRGVWIHARKDGSTFHAEITASILELDGRLVALSMAQDITAKLAAERSLREKDRQLLAAQKMEAVGRLAGGVAHEFNNILTGIIGLATLIQQQLRSDDPAAADASGIVSASKRAAGLVQRLLAFSRQGERERRRVDLNETLTRNRAMALSVLGERVLLELKPCPRPLVVSADSDQLDLVLLNLCLNARDAIKDAGRVRVATRGVELREPLALSHGTLPKGSYAVLRVEDNGHGIAAEHEDHVFEPFFTTRRLGRGTGLGLSIAYGIARDHEGLLAFESRRGSGTAFELFLPLAPAGVEDSEPEAAPAPKPAPPGSRGVVLVADDEAIVRDAVARILEPHGFRLLLAADGEEAVRLFESEPGSVTLVLLDVVMPKLDGIQAFERIRKLRPEVPTLFMSGYATARARDVIRTHGAAFLPKPFAPGDLLARIDRVLGS